MWNNVNEVKTKEATINLAQAAATYTAFTASGNVLIDDFSIYVVTAGATFTSVSIQTNDTNAFSLMTAAEGAVANIVEGKAINTANQSKPFQLRSGKLITYTIVGSTGTGSINLVIKYRPATSGTAVSLS